jgi:hypothetical protein
VNYNNCDDVWKFELNQCNIKGETFQENSAACKIVALDASNNSKENPQRKVVAPKKKKGGQGGNMGKRKGRK